jgi:hypothetical protein
MEDSGQTRFNKMQVLILSGITAPMRIAKFTREYTNRDGSVGLPPSHIGATSPYIDGGGHFYMFYHDNANDAFTATDISDAGDLTAAEVVRVAAVASNKTLITGVQGTDSGFRNV